MYLQKVILLASQQIDLYRNVNNIYIQAFIMLQKPMMFCNLENKFLDSAVLSHIVYTTPSFCNFQ